MFKEFQFISQIKESFPAAGGKMVGIGDDCAVLPTPQEGVYDLFTTDCLVEGIHFLDPLKNAFGIGYKLGAVNLSDIAAMGGVPQIALMSIAIPQNFHESALTQLIQGLKDILLKWNCSLVGGDTSSSKKDLFVNLVVKGQCVGEPWLRSNAKIGDYVYVTGKLGGSILGRHLQPNPRLDLVPFLRSKGVRCAMDISDGLSGDMGHICQASHCSVELWAEHLPIHDDAIKNAKRTSQNAIEHVLRDGEDFELIFTLPMLLDEATLQKYGLYLVGKITDEPHSTLFIDGRKEVLALKAFEHE